MNSPPDATEAFRSAMSASSLTPPTDIIADGKIHRFPTNRSPGDAAGFYCLHGSDLAAGFFGDWRRGITESWQASNPASLTAEQRQSRQQRLEQLQEQREAEEASAHAAIAVWAADAWEAMHPAPADHPYLVKKRVSGSGLRVYRGEIAVGGLCVDGALVVPLRDMGGKIWSLEFILKDGTKRFLAGGRKRGCFCVLGEITDTVCIAEGYATGASVHQATNLPIVIALDAGNLRPVAEAIRGKYPSTTIIICGDNDASGTGQTKAHDAAQAVDGLVAIPGTAGFDWNDVHQRDGFGDVRAAIYELLWPHIIPLDDVTLPDFPVDAFPDPLRSMIKAEASATETPVELAAMMGLGTVSAACQGNFEVQVEPGYSEPCNVWLAAALESGNRKTQVHRDMTEPIRVQERELCEAAKEKIMKAESERATVEARVKGIRSRIANSEDIGDFRAEQAEIDKLLAEMPDIPPSPRLWVQDITPEKLGAVMADNGERLALLSDEGGLFDILAGRYSNGVPNLDLFLQSHAGAPVRVDRGSRPSLVMHRPALTMVLSPQPGVLQGLAGIQGFRSRGLLARLLYALPTSKLGYRQLRTIPVPSQVRSNYHGMVNALLKVTPPVDEQGEFGAHAITLSPEAKIEHREFALTVEAMMRPDQPYEHLKDWAGKLPGAALRVAGLFHCVQYAHQKPWEVPISLETMTAAITVLAVVGEHTRAVFSLMGADPALDGARRVWRWIERKQCRSFTANSCFQSLKGTFSRTASLDPAFSVLCERGYLRPLDIKPSERGRPSRYFTVNPDFTKEWS